MEEIQSLLILSLLGKYLNHIEREKRYEKEELILMPITRKGYWLFWRLYERKEKYDTDGILSRFTIRSDRYLTKALDGEEFFNKHVLLFDDTFISGNNMFYFYTILTKWGADVTPIAYKNLISNIKDDDGEVSGTRRREFDEISRIMDTSAIVSVAENYAEYEREFECKRKLFEKEIQFLTQQDMSWFAIKETKMLEDSLSPLIIDLPIFVDRHTKKRKFELSWSVWDFLIGENAEWRFVKNISEEVSTVIVNGSFFSAPPRIREIFSGELVEDCIIKCKYKIEEEGVQAVFVPFVIMKSITYEDLVTYFIALFDGTVYYDDVLKIMGVKREDDSRIKEQLITKLETNVNLYRALYRAIIWYFSNYIGMEFSEYYRSIVDDADLDYDWGFMEHHTPKKLIDTIEALKNTNKEKIAGKIIPLPPAKRILIQEKEQDIMENNKCISNKNINSQTTWEELYYYMKKKMLEMKKRKQPRNEQTLTIEEIETEFERKYGFSSESQRRVFITRIITLFQEGSCFGNYVTNNRAKKVVERGFLPGENSCILVGAAITLVFPFVYEFQQLNSKEDYQNKYMKFMDILRAYFQKQGYFKHLVTPRGYQYCVDYFENAFAGENPQYINHMYIMQGDLEGSTHMYEGVRELVASWDV